MEAVVNQVADEMRQRLGAIRLPDTGEFPTVAIHGNSLETRSFTVEGSPELIALVRERLGTQELGTMTFKPATPTAPPRAFLSYAWEDRDLAERLANALQLNGVDTWWAGWSISAGDSLRQKIDEGPADCPHFLVLLTPTSIRKPWVNQEMDAGLVRKLNEETRFVAVRWACPRADCNLC
jgi:hypothetical protein